MRPGRIVLPAAVAERAVAVADGRIPAPPAERATSIVLVRPTAERQDPGSASDPGFEVYLQRRHGGMGFAAGMAVFPGGRVDGGDVEVPGLAWRGPRPADWASWFASPPSVASAHLLAGVREVLEETGVALLGDRAPALGSPEQALRQSLLDRDAATSFGAWLLTHGLCVRADLVHPWARWLTPRFERRRFDTWFLVCVLPSTVEPVDVSGETDRTMWLSPDAALEQVRAGELAMLPPTVRVLGDLLATLTGVATDLSGALLSARLAQVSATRVAEAGALPTVAPGVTRRPDGSLAIVLPGDPGYPGLDPLEGR